MAIFLPLVTDENVRFLKIVLALFCVRRYCLDMMTNKPRATNFRFERRVGTSRVVHDGPTPRFLHTVGTATILGSSGNSYLAAEIYCNVTGDRVQYLMPRRTAKLGRRTYVRIDADLIADFMVAANYERLYPTSDQIARNQEIRDFAVALSAILPTERQALRNAVAGMRQ